MTAALPLVDHGADVAAVLQEVLNNTAWADRLAAAAGRALTTQDAARLEVLADLHDLGKCNRGFWGRQVAASPRVGHTNVTAALFAPALADRPVVRALSAAIRDWGCEELFVAIMAHHGLPLESYSAEIDSRDRKNADRAHWRGDSAYDPLRELERLLADARRRRPSAFDHAPALPSSPAFVALVGGLVTLADWLGSDTALFPVAGPHFAEREGLRDISAPRAVTARGLVRVATRAASFEALFGFPPRGVQCDSNRLDLGPIALIEAETGSGKTEAALWRWLALRHAGQVDGLYFALPTRSAAVQLHARVNRLLSVAFDTSVEAVLAVPGYLRAGDADGQALPDFAVTWSDGGNRDARWAAEAPKRFLAARVAVGTIDQVLLSGLQVRHAHFRAAMLARSLLVVDEVHASDAFMGEVLRGVLRNHLVLGGQALLLSATLGAEARARLLGPFGDGDVLDRAAAEAMAYPAISGSDAAPIGVATTAGPSKRVHVDLIPTIDDADAIAVRAIAAAEAGASVLVVRNSVAGAVVVARAVERLAPALAFRVAGVATLHHGRFAPGDRRLLDAAVGEAFGKNRNATGRILCGTQTLEQSLDIDADLLITDLAPVDVLLQRIGRLHRHARTDRGAFREAQAVVLVPGERDLSRYFGRIANRHGLGPLKTGGGVYPDLLVLEATWRLFEARGDVVIPRDNRALVEGALHPDVLAALADALGTDWLNHGARQSGIASAERGLARQHGLDLRLPFSKLLFPVDKMVATRLGGRDRVVDFALPPTGPFGQPVARLTVPQWMAEGIGGDVEASDVKPTKDGFTFVLEQNLFDYGRFGLALL